MQVGRIARPTCKVFSSPGRAIFGLRISPATENGPSVLEGPSRVASNRYNLAAPAEPGPPAEHLRALPGGELFAGARTIEPFVQKRDERLVAKQVKPIEEEIVVIEHVPLLLCFGIRFEK